jgi:CRP-like cAMP-binding protein
MPENNPPEPHFLLSIFPKKDFKDEELDLVISKFKRVTFSKHDYLLIEGNLANHYWFVESGFIRSFAVDPDGNDITTHFFSSGDIVIDWPSFFMRNPTRENIQALSQCVCWQLDFTTFQELFHSMIAFRESGRARLVGSYFELKNHHVSMIVDQAKERYQRLIREKPQIVQNVSLKQIATYLGITDTSLSRIRKELSQE